MKIGIFGGTFNPPHIGHIKSAEKAAQALGLDRLIVIPAANPPHKQVQQGTPPAEMRYDMARLAFAGVREAYVSDIEIADRRLKYTVDTLRYIMHDFPGGKFYLLVGTDMYLSLESWKDAETLIKAVTPAVFSRNSSDNTLISEHASVLREKYGVETVIIENDAVDISSSQLREMLPDREGLRYIPDTIYAYIIKNRLYGAKPDWDWLRGRAYSMLDPARIPHVAGCEAEALLLAARWSVDADDAREAAILHDITKKLTPEENLKVLAEHEVGIKSFKPGEEKLLHSKTGAVLAENEFGVTKEVADAIMWHTTGRPGMSTLEKIIYLADYIEPTRDIEGVDDLRESAYCDLDGAVIMGLEMSISDMRERGIAPNRVTFDALSDLAGNALNDR